jgi:hypothetical protein
MPKFIAYELFEVDADSAEDAFSELSKKRNGIICVASSLGELFHPVHLADAQAKFGHLTPVTSDDTDG